jgi:hypothetical protein
MNAYRNEALADLQTDTVERTAELAADLTVRRLAEFPLGPLTTGKQPDPELSEQTFRVLRLTDEAKTYPQMADGLGIAKPTMAYHLQRAEQSLEVD